MVHAGRGGSGRSCHCSKSRLSVDPSHRPRQARMLKTAPHSTLTVSPQDTATRDSSESARPASVECGGKMEPSALGNRRKRYNGVESSSEGRSRQFVWFPSRPHRAWGPSTVPPWSKVRSKVEWRFDWAPHWGLAGSNQPQGIPCCADVETRNRKQDWPRLESPESRIGSPYSQGRP